ncbi:hypothetical protein KP509_33G068100 [Ceratopteris richardii]|uniref:Fungal lipase-type domain-containing protein n=1 Tax=Ceratopteris richardii TaxID=49495 RepID=A0A8T2QQQ7_CERRI|nr:hypothetical protein KP509_33G068100 [Ceratopteris richardii]
MSGVTGFVGSIQRKLDSWARQQRELVSHLPSPFPQVLQFPKLPWGWKWHWQWPWQSSKLRKEQLEEEYERRKEQLHSLCLALKAEDVADLKDILSAMILSECVYKRPESEVVRCVNKFSADFGGQLVQLQCIEVSLDHVPHRYLLAESGDTIFASFIGTKHYKDMITDANILQRPLFSDDVDANGQQDNVNFEETVGTQGNSRADPAALKLKLQSSNGKRKKRKPAAHRGFLARARGIPAAELYRLAKKKDRRLVLCGHSLGGAVAVLTTLAILKVLGRSSSSSPSNSKKEKHVNVKCITFSQPPVGNAALRDYVNEQGWHGHFRTYCIPEDLIPRILSPAYFQHFRSQSQQIGESLDSLTTLASDPKEVDASEHVHNDTPNLEQGVPVASAEGMSVIADSSPLHNSLQRLSALVPFVAGRRPFHPLKNTNHLSKDGLKQNNEQSSKDEKLNETPVNVKGLAEPTSLAPLSRSVNTEGIASPELSGSTVNWRNRVPSLPSYVPFGQLFLLEKSSVGPLSASEYTLLTSMQSVLVELRGRFQSHTMRSYRARFQRIYDSCMCDSMPPNFSMEHVPYLPHLQQWLGLPGVAVTELRQIADPLTLLSATSLVPIGWTGIPGDKKGSPFRVDICGYGLHLCTLVKAQINGQWCSASMELFPPKVYSENDDVHEADKTIQRMRIRIGQPIQEPSWPWRASAANSTEQLSASSTSDSTDCLVQNGNAATYQSRSPGMEDLTEVTIHCSSDFMTASKKVALRLRRVRLLGLEGAGKTSLYHALVGQGLGTMFSRNDGVFPDVDRREGVAQGIIFIDPAGVSLQDLAGEADQLKQELSSARERSQKVDLVILVHNLAHKIPRMQQSVKPALSLLIDEVAAAEIPWILAITNKFAVSADRRQSASVTIIKAYEVPPNLCVVVNSSPYALYELDVSNDMEKSVHVAGRRLANLNSIMQGATQKIISVPVNLVQYPFRKKRVILPVDGVKNLRELVESILLNHEDASLMEFSEEQLLHELKFRLAQSAQQSLKQQNLLSSAAAASALGASVGLVLAFIAAAASGLRKP